MPLRPRTFFRIWTLAWLSASRTGLASIPQEVIIAIAVRHPREFRRDPLHEGVLLVRHPEDDPLAQNLGPLLCLSDQPLNLFVRRGDQGLGEPDTLLGQFAHGVEGLVPLLGLQAVDRQDDVINSFILPAHGLEVLLARGEHGLIALNVEAIQGSLSLMA